jgi:hypothetical protein
MLYSELQNQVLTRGGIDTTSTFITETNIREWLDSAHKWAAAYKKWPFTEYLDTSGYFVHGGQDYDYPNPYFKTDSIRLLFIGDALTNFKIFDKKVFNDFVKYVVDYPSGIDTIFSDYGRILYINRNCASGTIVCCGQLTPPTLGLVASSSASTVFSNYDEEGDDAVIDKACSYAFRRMRKFNEANDFDQRARLALEELWKRVKDEQPMYQTKDRQIFSNIDVLNGNYWNSNNPLQF